MFRLLHYALLIAIFVLWFTPGCAAPKGVYHTVQRGQTLYRIGQVYRVDVNQLARINRLTDRSQLEVGQRLFIPGAGSIKYVPATVVASSKKSVKLPTRKPKKTATSRTQRPASTTKPNKSASPGASRTNIPKKKASAAKGVFVWPVRGSVVKKFGQSGSHANKGIEVAVPAGSAVVAAAAGKVTYSGDGIKGFGNLIILKHDDSYFTVYGFNQANLVKSGNFVSQGQKIALAGRSPTTGQPRLHFEIRRGKEAVNPVPLLP
jgi:lipoprotein YgeR